MSGEQELAERCRAAREERGLSYREAASLIGILPSTLHRLEHAGGPAWGTVRRVEAWLANSPLPARESQWVTVLVDYLTETTDTLDFRGEEIPPRLQHLLESGIDERTYP